MGLHGLRCLLLLEESCCIDYAALTVNGPTILPSAPQQTAEISSLQVAGKAKRSHLLATQPFNNTFGSKAQRKRPRLSSETYGDLLSSAQQTKAQCAPCHVQHLQSRMLVVM